MPEKNVTIQEVAKHAGVSTATISRTLSNPDLVSEATRELVLKAVNETGYRVNRAARNLRTQRSNAILVLLPDMGNPFFSQILQGIETGLSPAGFSMLVAETGQIFASEDNLIDYFRDGRADGMIILDGGLDPKILDELSAIPEREKIVCACEWFTGAVFPSVRSSNRKGSIAAIEYLYELGHRKIAHIAGPEGNVLTDARRDAAIEALTRLGIPPAPEHVLAGDFSLDAGRLAAKKIYESKNRPTAVFCASDQIAFGLIAELTSLGVSVPNDISVIGFDDLELSEYYIPSLTTMRQNRLALGKQAAEILLPRVKGIAEPSHNEIIVKDVDLIVRNSCAAIA